MCVCSSNVSLNMKFITQSPSEIQWSADIVGHSYRKPLLAISGTASKMPFLKNLKNYTSNS